MPGRYLGLVSPAEISYLMRGVKTPANLAEQHVNPSRIMALAVTLPPARTFISRLT